ncbi:MAG: hypothetical protein U1E42_02770 [Rhodospirillales bacterium]
MNKRGAMVKRRLAPAAVILTAFLLADLLPSRASAIESYSALVFSDSIGVNSVLSETTSPSRYDAAKDALKEIGIVNHRAKVTPFNVGRARDLFQCCGIRTLARIDVRAGGGKIGKADPSKISHELDTALSIGTEALVGIEGPNEYTALQHGPGWDDDLRVYTERLWYEVKRRNLSQAVVGPTIYLRSLDDIKKLGNIGDAINASNFHIYTSGNEPSFRMDEWLADARLMAPGEPVWVTEFGYHNTMQEPETNPVSELAAAKYLPRFIALYFSRSPKGKFFIYELINSGTNPRDREHNLGIMRADLSKKPAFYTIKRMISAVKSGSTPIVPRDLAVQINGETPNLQQLLLQKSANEYALLLWQEVKSWDSGAQRELEIAGKPVTVSLPTNATFTLQDTLPFENDPARDASPTLFGGPRRSVTFDVPDHIVVLQIKLS